METARLPRRLLLGPGPSNVPARVLAALSEPIVGHMDPAFLALAGEVQSALRRLFGTANPMTWPVSGTGSAGMETCFANLLEPGDTAVIGVAGVFGERMCEVATRLGARVARVESEPGTPLEGEAMAAAIARAQPRLVACVHAETSTGVLQPLEAISQAAQSAGAYFALDCVTSLGGLPLALDAWGVDAAYAGTQKCLSCPPGLAPASFSPRAVERVRARHRPVSSWYLDVSLLASYYGGTQRVYHHTAPVGMIAGLHEALRVVEEEGLPAREARHRAAADALVAGIARFGLSPLVPAAHRLPMLCALRLPEDWTPEREAELRRRLLAHHGIEVGGGLGKLAGRIWRVGLMGENARLEHVETLLAALGEELGPT
jgi:alanine-glyoxylate transaminase/serine-glyoxylate transaminase/serine-pyruvate transaminase